jgi:hypothetical protein
VQLFCSTTALFRKLSTKALLGSMGILYKN